MANLNETVKYLDLAGLLAYDALIKQYSDNKDAEVLEDVNDLIEEIGTGLPQGEAGKALISLTQTNGVVTATAGTVAASNITTNFTGAEPVSATANVLASLEEIYGLITTGSVEGAVSVWTDVNGTQTLVNSITEFGKTYTFKLGTSTIATMNLARDMVVSGGSVITATSSDAAIDNNVVVGEKYIKLLIANSTDVLYIPVNSLYKDHTTELNASKVQLTISNDNVISADVVAGSIEKTDLTTALQTEISAAATIVNAKSTGHVQVSVTAASGSNPSEVTVTESDIASATGQVEIAGKIGLTGDEGSRVYSTNVGGSTVISDINTLDGRIDSVEAFTGNMTPISSGEISNLFSNN